MRLLSWNIQGRSCDLGHTAAVLRQMRPDVILLQECDLKVRRSGRLDQAREIARRIEMPAIFAAAMRLDDGYYGLAVLTRRTVEQVKTIGVGRLAGTPEPRIAIAVSGPRIPGIATTHLSQKPLGAAFAELADLLPRLPEWAGIVLGDLNHTPHQAVPPPWQEWSPRARTEYMPTWPADRPTAAIDRVLARGKSTKIAITPIYAGTSDHLPIFVEIQES